MTYQPTTLEAKAGALEEIERLLKKNYTASGLILEIKDLSGNTVLGPVCLNNNSHEVLEAIKEKN